MGKPYIDFAAIKAQVSITQVLEHYGLLGQMRSIRNGDGLEGPCPINKGSSDDNFKVSVSKNCWNCFGNDCKCGGNVLDFVAKMEKVDAHEAAHLMNGWFGLSLDKQSPPPREERRNGSGEYHKSATMPTTTKQAPTGNHSTQVAPVEVPPEETGPNEPLKFALKNLKTDHAYFAERGLLPETVKYFDLGYCAKGTMSGRIVIPIHNREGELVGYAGRWPGHDPPDDRPKYKLPTGFHKLSEVFNLHRALSHTTVQPLIIVEGFFEVMLLWQIGFHRAVSLMGSYLSERQEEQLIAAADRKSGIILMFDEDEAGRTGREKALCRLAQRTFVRLAVLPREGAQPDHLTATELTQLLS